MTVTSTKIKLDLLDNEYKEHASVSTTTDLAPFSDVDSLLPIGNVYKRPFASFEPDFWLLDGTFVFRSDVDSPPAGTYLTADLSDAVGEFNTPPNLWIELSEPCDITALTVYFDEHSDEWASIDATYYDAVDAVLATDASDGASVQVLTANVNGVSKIKLVFAATSVPYRRLRITAFDFGEIIWFTGADIIEASVIEECRPLSDELPINTLSLRLQSADDAFNILNPQGVYVALNDGRSVTVYETVDGADVLIGRFFLDEWENTGDREIQLECVDWIGVMDRLLVKLVESPGDYSDGYVSYFLKPYDIPYTVDPSLPLDSALPNDPYTMAYLTPGGTLREAIQQLAFALGAAVVCSRSTVVQFIPSPIASSEEPTATITRADRSQDASIELRPMLSAVELVRNDRQDSLAAKTWVDVAHTPGNYIVYTDHPINDVGFSLTGATLIFRSYRWFTYTVATSGNVKASGYEIPLLTDTVQIDNPDASDGLRIHIKITDAVGVNAGNIDEAAQRVYDYYSQRYVQKCRLFAPSVVVGQTVVVETFRNQTIKGVIEKMDIDLARGMVADVEIRGVVYEEV